MQIGHSSFSLYGLNSDFIVYPSNGKVKLFKLSEIVHPNNKTKIKRIKIKKKEYQRYWDFLNTVVREGKFKIDQTK
ncbi:hypothetical protein [Cellulophaga baltica]|uniref:hypothetical protein n=1 Tax=Cellulophaga baltica TaxID=76594 RepID=UPI0024948A92|nr:hypothetical protein [Cellulophaga baltica]